MESPGLDETGAVSDWSEAAKWEMGYLKPGDWRAQWIGSPLAGSRTSTLPAPHLRREFTIDRQVASARLYVTARGLYEFSLNGERVGNETFYAGRYGSFQTNSGPSST